MIRNLKGKKKYLYSLFFFLFLLFSCKTTSTINREEVSDNSITLIFGGDVMAHTINYSMTDYSKIWRDIKYFFTDADFSFCNLEAPIDQTKPSSSYPNFNMPLSYAEEAVKTGFNVFSLCNNHTNDQALDGIKQTQKSADQLTQKYEQQNHPLYFSGLRTNGEKDFTFNLIKKNDWTILFLPITEILNRPTYTSYINYVQSDEKHRKEFISYCKTLKENNPCDLFIISVHANEAEYTRKIPESQDIFYQELLEAGADVVWANHAHIIKDRKFFLNMKNQSAKIIMYANGNTISGQRTAPDFSSSWPTGERDNTGDGLLYKIVYTKDKKKSAPGEQTVHLNSAEPFLITSYINTAGEIVLKPLNNDFVEYLNQIPRKSWADYIQKRIKINEDSTKDILIWQ